MRSATLMLGGPSATAVAIGPFSATCVRRTDSTACSRGNSPTRLPSSSGAANTSHSTETPEASTICVAAFATSGPIPSPGSRVILCVIVSIILRETPQIVENRHQLDLPSDHCHRNGSLRKSRGTKYHSSPRMVGKAFRPQASPGRCDTGTPVPEPSVRHRIKCV